MTQYEWDQSGRLVAVRQPNREVSYSYDEYGNLLTLTYPDRTKVIYTYDIMNRMESMKERNGQLVTYEYDTEGNLAAEKRGEDFDAVYTYDALNRMLSLENRQGNQLISGFAYTYDQSGRMVKEEATDPLGTLVKGYSYNEVGKLVGYEETQGEEALLKTTYIYDTFGNKIEECTISKTQGTNRIIYTYDNADRLKTKTENGKVTADYTYDKDGNLTRKKEAGKDTVYTYTTDNRLATTTVNGILESAVTYDGNGLKTFELLRKEYDKTVTKEELTDIRESQAALKEWKKYYQTSITVDTVPESVTHEATEEQPNGRMYDSLAFYTAHTVGALAPPLWEKWLDFAQTFFDDLKSLFLNTWEETEETAVSKSERNAISRQIEQAGSEYTWFESAFKDEKKRISYYEPTSYVYDLTVENAEVLAEYAGRSSDARETYHYGVQGRSSGEKAGTYIYDGRGSVSSMCKAGKVTTTLRYDPYGTITAGAPSQERIYGYNGEQYTPQTGLVYLRARNYDPETGTFTSKDTYLGNQTESVTRNRYTYGNNNPVMYQDPSGHAGLFSKIVKAVKKVVSKVVKAITGSSSKKSGSSSSSSSKKSSSKAVTKASSSSSKKSSSSSSKKSSSTSSKKSSSSGSSSKSYSSSSSKSSGSSSSKKSSGSKSSSSGIGLLTALAVFSPVSYYISKVAEIKTNAREAWEATKDTVETVLGTVIMGEELVAEGIQRGGQWWQGTSLATNLRTTTQNLNQTWKNSSIGKTVAAVSTKVNKTAAVIQHNWNQSSVGKFCNQAATSVNTFYQEHKTVINTVIGIAVIGACAAATIATGGAAGSAVAHAAAKCALKGSIDLGVKGAVGGAYNSAKEYLRENGTLDDAGEQILQGASAGFAKGAITGAVSGKYCFVAGTLLLTSMGLQYIQDIRVGDQVYAMDTETGDMDYQTVLDSYINQTEELYTVTIDGEEIRATAGHPFYTTEEGWVAPKESIKSRKSKKKKMLSYKVHKNHVAKLAV